MHSFAHHHHRGSGEASAIETNGLILTGGWRYDLHGWLIDICLFRGQVRQLRQHGSGGWPRPKFTADRPCPRESGAAPSAHRVPGRGDRATRLFRSDLRCGALDLDDASFACESQTAGTGGNCAGAQTRRAPDHCRFQAQAGTSRPGSSLSRWRKQPARAGYTGLGRWFHSAGNGADAAATLLCVPWSRLS
jgi:hypothetical protein